MSEVKPKPVLTLQSGIIVLCNTEVRGGVKYETREMPVSEAEKEARAATEKAEVEKRETIKTTDDADEHARALKVRNWARARIESVGTRLPFAILCHESKAEALDEAIEEAEAAVRKFNAGAKFTRVEIWPVKCCFVSDDQQEKMAQGIAKELAGLMAEMKAGAEAMDPDRIKSASRKVKAIATMIDAEAKGRVSAALASAKLLAKEIAKALETEGTKALDLVLDVNKRVLEEVEKSFTVLDLDGPVESGVEAPIVSVSAVDEDTPATTPEGELVDAAGEHDPAQEFDEPIVEKQGPEELSGADEPANADDVDASRAVDADAAEFSKAADGVDGEPVDA